MSSNEHDLSSPPASKKRKTEGSLDDETLDNGAGYEKLGNVEWIVNSKTNQPELCIEGKSPARRGSYVYSHATKFIDESTGDFKEDPISQGVKNMLKHNDTFGYVMKRAEKRAKQIKGYKTIAQAFWDEFPEVAAFIRDELDGKDDVGNEGVRAARKELKEKHAFSTLPGFD